MSNSPARSDASQDTGDGGLGGHNKTTSSKDKECQYCHQKFTSSSLGRHLDQFISKKKPDGIHDVDEIRRMRGGITRRTARSSRKGGGDYDGSQTHSGPASPSLPPTSASPAFLETLNKGPPGSNDMRFNRMNWQATGVITDPATLNTPVATIASPVVHSPALNTSVAGTKRNFTAFVSDLNSSNANDTTRALELSLREVLDAVRAATKHTSPPPAPFEFDLPSQTFSYLCLALLPSPPTLFQTAPFATPSTIPLTAPGPDQQQALRQTIPFIIDNWKWDALAHIQRHRPQNTNIGEEAELLSHTAQTYIETSLAHLDTAYSSYMLHSLEQRQHLWTVELLRAYQMEKSKVKDTKGRMERLTQEAGQLQQQVDYLSRCQWPREMALWPPDRATFDSAVQKELKKLDHDPSDRTGDGISAHNPSLGTEESSDPAQYDRWDFDKLVNKWKKHVREDRARRTGVQPSVSVAPSAAGGGLTPVMSERGGHDLTGPGRMASPLNGGSLKRARAEASGAGHHTGTNGHNVAPGGEASARGGGAGTGAGGGRGASAAPSENNSPVTNGANANLDGKRPSRSHPGNVSIISDVDDHMRRFSAYR